MIEREYELRKNIISEEDGNEAVEELAYQVKTDFSCVVSEVFKTAMNESYLEDDQQ